MKLKRSPLRNEADGGSEGGAPASAPAQPAGSSLATPPSATLSQGGSASTPTPAPSWRDSLSVPDEVRTSPIFENVKDPSDAITQLYHAQKHMGAEKLLKPQEGWTDEQYNDFYKSLGRPDSAGEYAYPTLPTEHDGLFNKEQIDGFKDIFHKAGLTQGQVDQVMQGYFDQNIAQITEAQTKAQQENDRGLMELQSKYGDKFEGMLHVAQSAVQHYGVADTLVELGLDRNPKMIEAFMSIGETAMETKPRDGSPAMMVSSQGQALQAIEQFKMNSDKMQALHDPKPSPAKESAQKEWKQLHLLAYPPTAQE